MEDITSSASDPPMHSLKLENHQGYPQLIIVQASSNSPSVGITVQDVLSAIQEDVRKLSRRREWTKLSPEERAQVDTAFRDRCKTEEELGQGPCRMTTCGAGIGSRSYRNSRLLARSSPRLYYRKSYSESLCEFHPLPSSFPVYLPNLFVRDARDESDVAGPSRIPIR
jgi:uncharacterized protein DUF6699